jgi:hypothetical protein
MNQMTEDDKYFLKEFLTSVFTTSGVFIVFIVILVVIINVSSGGKPLESSFEVVDTYEGCDIVRWTNHQFAEYKYFLYCGENK